MGTENKAGRFMEIESKRLLITLLTLPQLRLWIHELAAVEEELACKYDAEPMSEIVVDIVNNHIMSIENDPAHYFYYSFWFIIRKTDRTVMGLLYLRDRPNAIKEVEICYGMGKNYRHNGYMTEAVQAFCHWAVSQKWIDHIIAETKIENTASQNILKRCGFVRYKQENTLWWKI
jgi:RimJ/RimL family protein N-acetyltransferase